MRVLIVDGQGGGMGKALVEQLKQLCPTQPLLAVGTNARPPRPCCAPGPTRAPRGRMPWW